MTQHQHAVYDFHTHTTLSDGVLPPAELVRRAATNGYQAIAITDHPDILGMERLLEALLHECAAAAKETGIVVIPGVELTQVPPGELDGLARKAKRLGARIVLVHGETIKEPSDPVRPGTNRAALESSFVDILAHPGFLTEADAALAKRHGTYLELSARQGHSLTNGHVARVALAAGVPLLVDSDTHAAQDLLTAARAEHVAKGAALTHEQAVQALQGNPRKLLQKLGY